MNHRTNRRRAVRALVALGACLAALVVLGSPGVAAQPIGMDHFVVDESHIEQEEHEGFCPDVPFLVAWSGHASVTFKSLVRGSAGPEMFSFKISNQDTYTNVENGRTLTFLQSYGEGDRKLALDGTILTGTFAGHVSVKMFGPDGRLVAIDAGSFTNSFVVDLVDLEDPEDDVVLEESIVERGPRELLGRDLCEDLVTYLG